MKLPYVDSLDDDDNEDFDDNNDDNVNLVVRIFFSIASLSNS